MNLALVKGIGVTALHIYKLQPSAYDPGLICVGVDFTVAATWVVQSSWPGTSPLSLPVSSKPVVNLSWRSWN